MVLVAPLQYLSTRDAAATPARSSFDEVLLAGLAPGLLADVGMIHGDPDEGGDALGIG